MDIYLFPLESTHLLPRHVFHSHINYILTKQSYVDPIVFR